MGDLLLFCVLLVQRAQSLHSCLILCDAMDCSPPGSSVHGIPQARILEWVAKKNKMRGVTFSDFKTSDKAAVIKTA